MLDKMSQDAELPMRPPNFSEWLFDQRGRDSLVGELADQASADPKFPRRGSPAEARAHLALSSADIGWFEALDTAVRDWAGR